MQKFLIVLLCVIAIANAPLFAADRILRVGTWAEAHNLNDIVVPDNLEYVAYPYAEFQHGRLSEDSLTAGAFLGLNGPYEIGAAPDGIFPALQGWLNYRLKNDRTSMAETGLSVYGTKDAASGTNVVADVYFGWYPLNRMTEMTLHEHYSDFHEGVRAGASLSGGLAASNLLEGSAGIADYHASLAGTAKSGLFLGKRVWLRGDAQFNILNVSVPASFDSYDVTSTGLLSTQISYIGERLNMTTGVRGNFGVDKVLTANGFFDGSSFDYSWMAVAEAGYFILKDLLVYGGAELHGSNAALPNYSAVYIGAQYFLL